MAEYTSEKMTELAEYVVESMDQEQLLDLAYHYIREGYEVNEEGFHEDWHIYFGLMGYEEDQRLEDIKPNTKSHPDLRLFRHEEGYEEMKDAQE